MVKRLCNSYRALESPDGHNLPDYSPIHSLGSLFVQPRGSMGGSWGNRIINGWLPEVITVALGLTIGLPWLIVKRGEKGMSRA